MLGIFESKKAKAKRLSGAQGDITREYVSVDQVPVGFVSKAQVDETLDLDDAISRAKSALEQLLPMEVELKDTLSRQLTHLEQLKLDREFQRIDLSFLSKSKWSDGIQCPLPLFCAFTPEQPNCVLRFRARVDMGAFFDKLVVTLEEAQPALFVQYYKPHQLLIDFITREHRKIGGSLTEVTLTAGYAGAMPESTRQKIHAAKPRFDQIFIIAEAPEWAIEKKQLVPPGDPLVVGQKGDVFYLIDMFDTTPSEEHVAREFTAGARKS